MPYIALSDFRSGLDLRRPALVAPAGTLQVLRNAHLTPGGDIEKRFAFTRVYPFAANTFGLAGFGPVVYTFKQVNAAAKSVSPPEEHVPIASLIGAPATDLAVETIEITMPAGKTAASLEDWDLFNGKIYSVIKATDGTFHHFYGSDYNSDIAKVYKDVPHNIRTFKSKVYAISRNKLMFSAIDDPLKWDASTTGAGSTTAIGQGFILLSSAVGSADYLTGLEIYYDQLAIASRYSTQIWEVDADPKNNNLRQTLRGAGTVSANSMLQYGSGDVLYLHDSGVRSLRAKDSSNAAAVSDIGSPIDPVIQNLIRHRSDANYIKNSFSLVEPNTGRFWLCFKDRIFVLSYYPGPKVTAWSEYKPEFAITDGIVAQGQVMFRGTDGWLYAYGGLDGLTYDSCEVEIETPYLSIDKPATFKGFTALDLAAWGEWKTKISLDPNRPAAWDEICTTTEPSFGLAGSIASHGVSTHMALNLKHKAPGAAKLSSVLAHYITNNKAD